MLPIKKHRVSVQIKWVRSFYLKVKVTQSCPTLWDPMDCSLPGLSWIVHGILQARILDWLAVPFSRGSSQPRDWTQASNTAGRFFTSWATREAHYLLLKANSYSGLWYLSDKAKNTQTSSRPPAMEMPSRAGTQVLQFSSSSLPSSGHDWLLLEVEAEAEVSSVGTLPGACPLQG